MRDIPPLVFLDAVAGYTRSGSESSADRPVRLARVDPAYTPFGAGSGYPNSVPPAKVTFEGESTLSTRAYAVAGGFVPAANVRVVMVPIGTTYIVAGAATSYTSQGFYSNSTGTSYGVEFGGGSYWDNNTGLNLETGADIAGNLLVGGVGKKVLKYKPSNTDRSSTIVANADPHLSTNLEAGVWHVRFVLLMGATIGDFRTRWITTGTLASATRIAWGPSPFSVNTTTPLEAQGREAVPMRTSVHNYATEIAYGMNSATLFTSAIEESIMNFTTAGSVALGWAQDTSDASITTLAAYSYMTAERLA